MATFSEMETRVKNWLENEGTEFDTEFTTMLENAELRISRELNIDAMIEHETTSLTQAQPFLAKPPSWVATRSMHYVDTSGDFQPIHMREHTFLMDYWPKRSTEGAPKFWSSFDEDTFWIAPTTNATITIELAYEQRIDGLSAVTTETWLSINHPDVLFAAILVEGGVFAKDTEEYALWEKRYMDGIATVQAEANRQRSDRNNIMETA